MKNDQTSEEMSHEDLIEVLASTFRLGKIEIIEPYLSENFIFCSEFILGYPRDKQESLTRMRGYIERNKGSNMIKTKSPYTGNYWLKFSENPRSSVLGMIIENGEITHIGIFSRICDEAKR